MAEVKYFTHEEEAEARKWVSEAATKYASDDEKKKDEKEEGEILERNSDHEIGEVKEKDEEVVEV